MRYTQKDICSSFGITREAYQQKVLEQLRRFRSGVGGIDVRMGEFKEVTTDSLRFVHDLIKDKRLRRFDEFANSNHALNMPCDCSVDR